MTSMHDWITSRIDEMIAAAKREERERLMDFDEWLLFGVKHGYASPPPCIIHDGYPTTAEENQELEDNGETCLFLIRPYPDAETKQAVEEASPQTVWRKGDLGLECK